MSRSKPPFHKQETTYSCVPACLRMVLSGLGLDLTEERLRELCDCSPLFGTGAIQAVEAARGLGFADTAKYTLRYDELRGIIEVGRYPVAYLSLEAIGCTEESHAVVVIEADDEAVTVYDPLHGERRLSRQSFTTGWAARRNLVILDER
ncbi:MAG: C39 family peptidase [Acidobacteria bacterium]|nr:C39 family peptidase [Acidobacteriota bacterium]